MKKIYALLLALVASISLSATQASSASDWMSSIWGSEKQEPGKNKTVETKTAKKETVRKSAGENKNAALWTVRCPKKVKKQAAKLCSISQELRVIKTKQRLLSVLIRQTPQKNKHTILISLPHGLFLPAGTTLRIDKNKPIRIPVQTADANGSYAGGVLDPKFLGALNTGKSLKISFLNSKRQPITVPVSLQGFSKAYSDINGKK